MQYVLLQAVFLPLLLSPVAYVLARKYGPNSATWFTFGLLLYCTTIMIAPVFSGTYEEHFPWTKLFGEFGFLLDGLASPFAIIIYVLSTVLALYSKPYMVRKITEQFEERMHKQNQLIADGQSTAMIESSGLKGYVNNQIGIYFALFLVFAMGMLGTVLATNLIEFYVFFEVMLIPGFFLIALYGYGARRRIALLFFFWTHVGAVVLLLGFLAIGLNVGSFDFSAIKEHGIPPNILTFAAIAIILGLGVKLAAFIFHIWLPYAHAEAPTPISALLSPAMIGIGGYGLFRLLVMLLPGQYEHFALFLNLWGLVTIFYGGIMALMQDDIKRLFAYSSISQMGYLIFGIGSSSALGLSGAEMMYVSHGLGKGLLFMMAGAIILQVGTRSMTKLGGLAGKMPITAVCAMIGALTIMGVPPTSGFMGEWTLFYGALQTALQQGSTIRMITFGLGLVSTVLTMAYILWMIKRVFFGKLPENLSNTKEASWYITAPMMVLAGFSIVVGIYPDIFFKQIIPFMNGVMGV
ncbi:MAG: NADH-quinone oxidoreductase subunit M [Thaumarchaeota archaeon]|nr:NADH-quinone oxidoreductase subunit M [Nitrososphaerota archaeon]